MVYFSSAVKVLTCIDTLHILELTYFQTYKSCNCNLISFVSRPAVNFGRMFSPMDCNVMVCCERYQQAVTVDNVFNCSSSPNAIRNYCISQVCDELRTNVLRLLELIMLRDNVMFQSNSEFHKCEYCDLINLICTS